ncbi:peptidase MA family metallohydrolase [Desulfotruncus alcoholivorax]|uniref:peptidase MA family metallohydrolase n=1 Tax=Desulfotruncus alcoholivorax TaxID=265477 RepID=UPI000406A78E|nr:peptidase MA family metallohydrolase [Desulfotruncus alcoholivorax]
MNYNPIPNEETVFHSNYRTAKLVSALLAVLFTVSVFLLIRVPDGLRGYVYSIFRDVARGQMLLKTHGWHQIEDNQFIIRYRGNEQAARLVQESSLLFYHRICSDFSYKPEKKIPIVIYSSKEELNASFNWPASENAMGVYWGGVIRVLAPEAWINANDSGTIKQIFQKAGPMAHEMTHLILDYVAHGNYPRWFTEGVAQYEEYKITGFIFDDQAGISEQELYPLKKMDRNFDSLPDQSLAYRQSLNAIQFIVAVYGENGLHKIINSLAQGNSFNGSLKQALGLDLGQFEKEWHYWLKQGEYDEYAAY